MLGIVLVIVAFWLFTAKRYYYSLLIFFSLITYGFLVIPPFILLYGAPVEKTSDLAVFYILAIIVYQHKTLQRVIYNERLFQWVLVFLCFVTVDAIYSYQLLGYDITGVIKVFRHYIFFLSFGIFILVPFQILVKILHTIAVITIFQSILYLLQIPTGLILLGDANSVVVNNMEQIGWVRYYNTPQYLLPAVFYFLFIYKYKTRIIHWLVVGILLVTVIAPMHRSYILTVSLVISMYLIFRRSNKYKFIYLGLIVLLGYCAILIDPLSSRLNDALNDIDKTFSTGRSLNTTDYEAENTFAYRMAHLFERVNYIKQNPERFIFGIGLLSEETKQAEGLRFEAGLYNERLSRVAQVNTGDIAWSLLIVHLGFFGTGLFVIVMLYFLKFFYDNRSMPISILGLLTLVITLLISFTGTELLMIHFRVFLLLTAVISLQEKSFVHFQNSVNQVKSKESTIDSLGITQTIRLT